MEHNSGRMFLSLRWKLVLVLAIVFFFVAAGTAWVAYSQQQRVLLDGQQFAQERIFKRLNSIVINTHADLSQQMDSLLAYVLADSTALPLSEITRKLNLIYSNQSKHLNSPDVLVLSPKGEVVYQSAILAPEGIANFTIVPDTLTGHAGINCALDCPVYVSETFQTSAGYGGIVLFTNMHSKLTELSESSGWFVGLLDNQSASAMTGPALQVHSRSESDQQVLSALANWPLAGVLGRDNLAYSKAGRSYWLATKPLLDGRAPVATWLLVADTTYEQHAIIKNVVNLFLTSWLVLFVCALGLSFLMQPALKSLISIAQMMPMLAKHEYESVLGMQKRTGATAVLFRDELSALENSTYELAGELQRLDKEVVNRTLRLHKSSIELAKQRNFVASLLDNAQAVIVLQDSTGNCLSINQFAQNMLGMTESQCLNHDFGELFGVTDAIVKDQLGQVYDGLRSVFRHESQLLSSTNSRHHSISWMHSRLNRNDSNSNTILSIGMDITEHKAMQNQLQWLSAHDSLTDLPNRTHFQHYLQSQIEQAEGNPRCAVIFCDLDHFKTINDSLGHPAGDTLLKEAARRLRDAVRNDDVVSRWGGDEFVVLIQDYGVYSDIDVVIDKIEAELAKPFMVEEQEVVLTVSMGIALCPEHGSDCTTLIKNADLAMYRAKAEGRKQHFMYSPEQSAQYEEKLTLDIELRRAVSRQEFTLHYQPQFNSDGSAVIGVEALIRWMHPEQGMIPPDRFISLAEENGQIVEIGDWVLRQACNQLLIWEDLGIQGLRMAVNVAGQQIMDRGFLARVQSALSDYPIEASQLELEITESFIMSRPETTIEKLNQLKKLNIQLSIDDFGTGYSSLSYLKKLPIDKLKIDKSFVFDIGRFTDDEEIAKAVIALGHSLDMTVIAEGVENERHVEFLREHGCDELQGFHFSKPLPAQACTDFLLRHVQARVGASAAFNSRNS